MLKKIIYLVIIINMVLLLSSCSSQTLERAPGRLNIHPPVDEFGQEINDAKLVIKNLDSKIEDKNWGLREIEVGTYIVRVKSDGHFNYGEIVEIKRDQVTTVEAKLEKLAEGKRALSNLGNKGFKVAKDGAWSDEFLAKGINLGMAKPNYFPGQAAITKTEYREWIRLIEEMNANIIRVYTIHPPGFYEALADYNEGNDEPIYLLHGAWIEEEVLVDTNDAFDRRNTQPFREEIKNIVDIIHGQAIIGDEVGKAGGVYHEDISDYVLGYIIGIEWEPNMVKKTNDRDMSDFNGEYFQTEGADPFEIWLAQQMEEVVRYEDTTYNKQRSISFSNWVTTDAISIKEKKYEPSEEEKLVSIKADRIKPKEKFKAGYFASYHVYPYYPENLNYNPEYMDYDDHRGKKNSYAAYLNHLQKVHNIPVLISEFGVSSSRGRGHTSTQGKHEGGLSEREQGEINKELFEDIVAEEMMGGLLFTWQDEFFKRAWNNQEYNNPERRPYWSNIQVNEQFYGVLNFDLRDKKMDGNFEDWNDDDLFYEAEDNDLKSLYLSSDAESLYFKLEYQEDINLEEEETYILLDSNSEQGKSLFSRDNIDFIVKIADAEARVLVDRDYDLFEYEYSQGEYDAGEKIADKKYDFITEEITEFNPIRRILNKTFEIPEREEKIYLDYQEAGKLSIAGNSYGEVDSLTDLAIADNKIEMRIPWDLLNFRDPSQREIISHLEVGLESSKTIEGIKVYFAGRKQSSDEFSMVPENKEDVSTYSWETWDNISYEERKKESYEIMRDLWG